MKGFCCFLAQSQVSNHSPDDSELASVSDAAPKESDGFILVNIVSLVYEGC